MLHVRRFWVLSTKLSCEKLVIGEESVPEDENPHLAVAENHS